jgi:hypothetical protein
MISWKNPGLDDRRILVQHELITDFNLALALCCFLFPFMGSLCQSAHQNGISAEFFHFDHIAIGTYGKQYSRDSLYLHFAQVPDTPAVDWFSLCVWRLGFETFAQTRWRRKYSKAGLQSR